MLSLIFNWPGLEALSSHDGFALGVSLWGPRPVGNSRDSHGLSFAGRWLQNMKPCPALPGLRPCREQLGFPMVSVLPAERGTMPSPTGPLTLSSQRAGRKSSANCRLFLALAGARGPLTFAYLIYLLSVRGACRGRFWGLWPHVYRSLICLLGSSVSFGGPASA